MNVQRRTETGWLALGLKHGERLCRCSRIGKDNCFEVSEIQKTAFPGLTMKALVMAVTIQGPVRYRNTFS